MRDLDLRARGDVLNQRVHDLTDTDRRLEIMLRAHRRRGVTRVSLGAMFLLLLVAGLLWVDRLDPDRVEPVRPNATTQGYLVLADGYETTGGDGCAGVDSFAGVAGGGFVEMIDLGAAGSDMVRQISVDDGRVVRHGDEIDFVLSDDDSEVCAFVLGDLGMAPEAVDHITFYPVVPDQIALFSVDEVNRAVFRSDHPVGVAPTAEPGPGAVLESALQSSQVVVVDLVDQGSALMSFGPECDRTEIMAYFGVGEVSRVSATEIGRLRELIVELTEFRDCEQVDFLTGYVETEMTGERLESREVGPVEVVVFDPKAPGRRLVPVTVDMRWDRSGSVTRYEQPVVSHRSWGWIVDATVEARISVGGVDLGPHELIGSANIIYKVGFTFGGSAFDALGGVTPSLGCTTVNDPAYDGTQLSPFLDADRALRSQFAAGETIVIEARGAGDDIELVGYLSEFGEVRESSGGEISLQVPHSGAYTLAWDAVDQDGESVAVDWEVSCRGS